MNPTLNFKLVAYEIDLYYAWKQYFDAVAAVEVIDGDIFAQQADAIVSPANSFGYMDGGLDLKISQKLGWGIEGKVRTELELNYFGELPVGNAIIVATDHAQYPFLISAPTMRVPANVSDTINAYLAFKAIIQAVLNHNKSQQQPITSILCPGLGSGEGRMAASDCARQMYMAYQTCLGGEMLTKGGLGAAVRNHLQLLGKES